MSPLSFTTARSAGPVFEGIMLWFWLASPRRAGQRGDGHALILPLSAADAANRISQQKKIRQVSAAQTRTAKFVANAEVALDRRTLFRVYGGVRLGGRTGPGRGHGCRQTNYSKDQDWKVGQIRDQLKNALRRNVVPSWDGRSECSARCATAV